MGIANGGSMVAGKNRLELFASRSRIAQYIPQHIQSELQTPIEIKKPNGAKAHALHAEVLPALCEAVVAAARIEALQEQQLFIAHQCEVLLSGLSRVGIIALVDEAAGCQKYREDQALQKILDAYILPEHRPWMKAVPVEFFRRCSESSDGSTKMIIVAHAMLESSSVTLFISILQNPYYQRLMKEILHHPTISENIVIINFLQKEWVLSLSALNEWSYGIASSINKSQRVQ